MRNQVMEKILELQSQRKTINEIGAIVGLTKNAVLGRIFRHKVKNGYVPSPNSSYARRRKYNHDRGESIGTRKCSVCEKKFHIYSRHERFCESCRKTVNSLTSWML